MDAGGPEVFMLNVYCGDSRSAFKFSVGCMVVAASGAGVTAAVCHSLVSSRYSRSPVCGPTRETHR